MACINDARMYHSGSTYYYDKGRGYRNIGERDVINLPSIISY